MRREKIEMVEINYVNRDPDMVLSLAKDLLSFGVNVELTTDTAEKYCTTGTPFEVRYHLTATCSKGIWMSLLMKRNLIK